MFNHVSTNELFCSFLILEEQLAPVFISKPESQAVYVGKNALIQCVIRGSPPLNVVWLKDNQSLLEVGLATLLECEFAGSEPFKVTWKKNKKPLTSDKKYRIISQGFLSSLEIQTFESIDAGEYECTISNDLIVEGKLQCFGHDAEEKVCPGDQVERLQG
uniref:Ig-like domain-containing protein n=1 Tax=Oryzias melastigma TaxID=30732 RepID=A0A3B3C3X0_ORYME